MGTEDNVVVDNDYNYLGVGRPGSVPFVSQRPGAYGRLLLAVYVRWKTGLLVFADWLRPVTRGAWRVVLPNRGRDPDPIRGPVGTSWLYKGALTERWTIIDWRPPSTHE